RDRPLLQGPEALRAGGRSARRADDRRLRRAADVRGRAGALRLRLRLYRDREAVRGVGRRRGTRLTAMTGANAARPLAVEYAHAVHALRFEELPAAVVTKAKLCVLDLLSSAFASSELPWGRQAAALARASSRTTAIANVIGTR